LQAELQTGTVVYIVALTKKELRSKKKKPSNRKVLIGTVNHFSCAYLITAHDFNTCASALPLGSHAGRTGGGRRCDASTSIARPHHRAAPFHPLPRAQSCGICPRALRRRDFFILLPHVRTHGAHGGEAAGRGAAAPLIVVHLLHVPPRLAPSSRSPAPRRHTTSPLPTPPGESSASAHL
jgi:hypothetical protein